MSRPTCQCAVMLCGWRAKAEMVHSACGWKVKQCDLSLTRTKLSGLEMSRYYCGYFSDCFVTASVRRSFGRPSQVTVRRMLRDRCPLCLSCPRVTLGYCGQTVGWIKVTLGMDVGLGQGDIVLDGNPAPPTERGTAAPPPLFGPCLL